MIGKKVADFVSINLGSYKEEATTLQINNEEKVVKFQKSILSFITRIQETQNRLKEIIQQEQKRTITPAQLTFSSLQKQNIDLKQMQELKKNESTNALIKINQDIDKNEGSFIRDLRKMKEIFRQADSKVGEFIEIVQGHMKSELELEKAKNKELVQQMDKLQQILKRLAYDVQNMEKVREKVVELFDWYIGIQSGKQMKEFKLASHNTHQKRTKQINELNNIHKKSVSSDSQSQP